VSASTLAKSLMSPVTAISCANEELSLHQSQDFWDTKGSVPSLAWLKIAVGSSTFDQTCDGKHSVKLIDGSVPSGAGAVFWHQVGVFVR
jgi:hypothetical protein